MVSCRCSRQGMSVVCLLKERHRGAVGGWRFASVVLVQQLDLANLVLKERWPLSAHRRNRVRNGSNRVGLSSAEYFRSSLNSGHRASGPPLPKSATTGLMHPTQIGARDERLPSHPITSLAIANNTGGKSSPSDLAVARLSTKSNLVIW
jgi:hypothetical protein